jgi:hypothetical protein
MSSPIPVTAVALSLMREAMTLLDTEETAAAAAHLERAIKAAEEVSTPLPKEIDESASGA